MSITGLILAILIFSFLVLFHEFGHFIMAKRGGIGVTEFALGMGPRLFGKKIGETDYCVKLLPLGGSCSMVGEDEDDNAENSFNSKGVWTRISVVAAGPIFNFIIAFLGALIIVGTMGFDKPVISDVMEGYPAQEAGVEAGDTVISMNGKRIHVYREVIMYIQMYQGKNVNLVYERDGKRYEALLEPKYSEENESYLIGLYGTGERTKGNVLQVIEYSGYEVEYWIRLVLESLGMMVRGQVGSKDVSGPVGIVKTVGDTYTEVKSEGAFMVFINMVNIFVLLSANLGVMNLLPIPALDGGRLVFLIIEVFRRKKISPEKEGYVHFAGFVLLMVLMAFLFFNDIRNMIIS